MSLSLLSIHCHSIRETSHAVRTIVSLAACFYSMKLYTLIACYTRNITQDNKTDGDNDTHTL